MSQSEADIIRRAKLRAVFAAMADLDSVLDPKAGWMPQSIAVENAGEELKDNFPDDYRANCEGCRAVILYGDQGHDTSDGCTLCVECAPTWGDIRAQWEEEGREEEEEGDRARFMAGYEKHIAGGGSPDDKVLYLIS